MIIKEGYDAFKAIRKLTSKNTIHANLLYEEIKPIVTSLASNPEIINFNEDGLTMDDLAEQLVMLAHSIAIQQKALHIALLEESKKNEGVKEDEVYDSVASI